MTPGASLPVTQRAYTLRLRRAPGKCPTCGKEGDCACWREALWATHQAVNRGAKAFGDWLLTLRGGLDHRLADAGTPEERRNRRVLLALSWLSVEDERGAPDGGGLRIATGKDLPGDRGSKVKAALRGILQKQGAKGDEIESWLDDCEASLEARIKEEAVWVNRSRCFDQAVGRIGTTLTREEVWDLLEPFFRTREAYFAGPSDGKRKNGEAKDEEDEPIRQDEKAKDLIQKAGQWLSARFGTGKGADFNSMADAYERISRWASRAADGHPGVETMERLAASLSLPTGSRDLKGVLGVISGPGYKSQTRSHLENVADKPKVAQKDLLKLKDLAERDAVKCKENAGRKGRRPWADKVLEDAEKACGFTYLQKNGPARHREFSVMLDHAARRVSIVNSWIKRQELHRHEFKDDAKKIQELRKRAPEAVEWLERFCEVRSDLTGASAEGGYRIRKRALGGKYAKAWNAIAKEWVRNPDLTETERIEAIHQVQSDWDEDEKFGEERLFKAIAGAPDYVWKDASILVDYAAGTTAEHNQRHLKVPAYRHPDPLLHPVFCDFGSSRWAIRFARHEWAKAHNGGRIAKKDAEWIKDHYGLRMGLWNSKDVREVDLRWSSKRLTADLALGDGANGKGTDVTRANRLGRAASDVFGHVAIMNTFKEPEWNGRLQIPRPQLERIARSKPEQADTLLQGLHWLVSFSPRLKPSGPFIGYAASQRLWPPAREIPIKPRNERDEWRGIAYPFWHPSNDKGRKGHAKHLLSRLPGLRVLSVDLGHRFAAACAVWEALPPAAFKREVAGLKVRVGGTGEDDLYLHTAKPEKGGKTWTSIYRRIGPDRLSGRTSPAPWARLNRQFLIKLQGEGEPARFAARQETDMVRSWEKALGRVRDETRKSDALPHRVDEVMAKAVEMLRHALRRHGNRARIAFGLTSPYKPMPGNRKYLFNPGPGEADDFDDSPEQRKQKHVESLQDTLILWHDLAVSARWRDEDALSLWNANIRPLIEKATFTEPPPLEGDDAEDTDKIKRREAKVKRWKEIWEGLCRDIIRRSPEQEDREEKTERKVSREALHALLKPVAEMLRANQEKQKNLAQSWAERWKNDDGHPRFVNAHGDLPKKGEAKTDLGGRIGWYKTLEDLEQWIAPRGLRPLPTDDDATQTRKKVALAAARHVGGLSVTRINTISGLYQLLKAFKMRPEPDDLRKNVPKKGGDDLADFNRRLLDMRDRLREQRVKQLASRIVEAALGVGKEHLWPTEKDPEAKCWCGSTHGHKDPKRPRKIVYPPCHAVVIESLTHYRPDDLRTRRENRQLMQWSSAKVQKYLKEGCQLYGLHLREVPANYTSRQCSRTGLPGVRCDDVPVAEEFLTAPWWNKAVSAARKKVEKNSTDAEARFFVELVDRFQKLTSEGKPLPRIVRVPRSGGDLFVAAPPPSCSSKGHAPCPLCNGKRALQADLNAAANIGLRALMDPDFPGKWWYVPCDPKTFKPVKEKVKGCTAINHDNPLKEVESPRGAEDAKKKRSKAGRKESTKEIVNLWRDLSGQPISADGGWREHKPYWNDVQARAVGVLRRATGI